MKIALCDDNKEHLKCITDRIAGIMGEMKYELREFSSGRELQEYMAKNFVDILCLDIQMPDIDGFVLANSLKDRYRKLIFISEQENLVYKSLECKPFRFVRKSCISDLCEAIKSAMNEIEEQSEIICISQAEGKSVFLNKTDIIYVEALKNKVIVTTENKKYSVNVGISEFINMLNKKYFYRVHKGFVVNLYRMEAIDAKWLTVVVNNENVSIPISRGTKESIISRFGELI